MDEVRDEGAGSLAFAVGGGALMAALIIMVPALRVPVEALIVVIHETGHTLAGWAYGYPAIPAFDLRYGGGITIRQAQSTVLLLSVTGLLGYVLWRVRSHTVAASVAGGLLLFHVVTAWTSLHRAVISAAGHGFELLVAALFLLRALRGNEVVSSGERALYGAVAAVIVFDDTLFAWGLMTDPAARARYGNAKGGGHWMDFSRLANEHLGCSLETVAGLFLLACLLTPVAALLWWWFTGAEGTDEAARGF